MIDDNGLDSIWEGDGMTMEDVKEAVEGNLCPKGRWEGQLQPVNPETDIQTVKTENGDHPLEGQKVSRLHAVVFTEEGEKHLFFDAFPSTVKAISKKGGSYIRQESLNAAHLYTATQLVGRPFGEVLKAAMDNRLVYDIGIRKAREDKETGEFYAAQNQIRGIYPLKKEVE